MIKKDEQLIEVIALDLFNSARDDYVGLWDVKNLVKDRHGPLSSYEVRQLSLRVVERLLSLGMKAVHLLRSGGYVLWENQQPDAVVAMIDDSWQKLDREPTLGDIAWFVLPQAST